MHIAQLHIFLTIATVLATLRIAEAHDASGNVIEPEVAAMPGAITCEPFTLWGYCHKLTRPFVQLPQAVQGLHSSSG